MKTFLMQSEWGWTTAVTWTILTMSLLHFWALKISRYQKYLDLCSEDERRSYGFRTTWGWVNTDRNFNSVWWECCSKSNKSWSWNTVKMHRTLHVHRCTCAFYAPTACWDVTLKMQWVNARKSRPIGIFWVTSMYLAQQHCII